MMNKKINRIARAVSLFLLAANIHTMSASDFGFCTNTTDRNNIFRLGTTEKQGLAIRLSKEKLAMLKGQTINSVATTVGSKRMTNGTIDVFITTDLASEPLVKQSFTVSSPTKWATYKLNQPYTITGDESCLYIGYTGEIANTQSFLMADFTADMENCSFAFKDGKWIDIFGMGFGNASIRFGVADAPALTDVIVKPLHAEGYFKAEEEYAMSCELFNFGTEPVTSFKVNVQVDGAEANEITVDDVNIAQGETFSLSLPAWKSAKEGNIPLSMNVTGVNGTEDDDISDNSFAKTVFCYPAAMERAILLEGFTGQACSNCPAGHNVVENFIKEYDSTPIIEVMHHSGYQPDYFTMDADMDYTFLYGSPNLFAPAVMLNRTTFVGTVPVMNTDMAYLQYGYGLLENVQPYASLSLETEFEPTTRELKVAFSTYAHADLPSSTNVINIMLVQDGLLSKQVPYGDNYQHNSVFRGVLTGNSWGVQLNKNACKAGGKYNWEKTLTLPEEIFSDYYDANKITDTAPYTWPVVPENMRIVAYVASYSDTPSGNVVYNAVETSLGESHVQGAFPTAVNPVFADAPRIMLKDRRVCIDGDYDSLRIFNIDGRTMNADNALTAGIYIVRVSKGNLSNTIKIHVK